ncbi:hypothetical protein [Peterkaempfera bronchialis]|uniref:Uncharacterized protein n=1 Tax=Peterkaempfera bronchialis TaxID=2126346 RepID=A0A345SXP4_9ACTN|nr:hypothetical protein [Peterkaempfera bronchialis]AXI78499.1 hypothetical protein C7M71_014730 [Peterkaempfera bronchialis]
MRAVIAWWDLDGSAQTVDSLREFLRDEAVDGWAGFHGLLLKVWIADRERNRWGAVQLWESAEAAGRPLPTRAAELIGFPPTERLSFEVEATTEGIHRFPSLARLGSALSADRDLVERT